MARLQRPSESTVSAAVRGALTGFVVAAVATVCLARAAEEMSGGTPTVELRLDTAPLELASGTPVIPFQHSVPVRPAA
jgi:hypothetical protein